MLNLLKSNFILQVVLCATASASPLPFFNLGEVFRGPIQDLARMQARVEQRTEDSYRAPEAGYGVPEAGYGAPESQCVCQQEPIQQEPTKKEGGIFGFLKNIFKPRVEPEVPQDAYGAPQDSYGVPQDSYGVPQDSYEVPQDAYGVPQDSYGVPEDSYGAPVENPCVCPTAEYGAPLVAPQATSYEAPEPVYSAPVPVYEIPEPAYEAPEPAYGAPEPAYNAPEPAYSAPTLYRDETTQKPNYAAPEASYEGPVATLTLPVDGPHVILDVRQQHNHGHAHV